MLISMRSPTRWLLEKSVEAVVDASIEMLSRQCQPSIWNRMKFVSGSFAGSCDGRGFGRGDARDSAVGDYDRSVARTGAVAASPVSTRNVQRPIVMSWLHLNDTPPAAIAGMHRSRPTAAW